MSIVQSILISAFLSSIVAFFAMREVRQYRAYENKRSDVFPYSLRRLILRLFVSFFMMLEILLLLLGRHALSPKHPKWFLLYVSLVIGFAGLMVLFAILDWRESTRLIEATRKRLYLEFLTDVERGGSGGGHPH